MEIKTTTTCHCIFKLKAQICENKKSCLDPQLKITARLILLLLNLSVETKVNVCNEPILL